jgi:glycosyltransferase involved in cell wall biosynthesis
MQANGFDVVAVSSNGSEVNKFTKNRAIRHQVIEMTRTISPMKDFIALIKLYRFIKKEKPDIVHTHTPKAGLLGMIAAKLANVPIRLHTVAGLPLMTSKGFRRGLLVVTEKLTYQCSTETLANSFSIASFMLKEQMISIDKLKVLGNGSTNGFDNNRFNLENLSADRLDFVKREISYNPELFYFLYVGRLVVDKGIDELYEAFHKLYAKNKSLRLIILGNFEKERDSLNEQRVVEIINHPGIIYLGWREDVEYFISIANTLVHPSHREGFPNILLQSASMQTPIICSNIPGNIDVVNNDNATLFEVKNTENLLSKMNEVFLNYAVKKNQATILSNSIIDKYSRETVQQIILDYYLEKLNSKENKLSSNSNESAVIKNGSIQEPLTSLNY